MNPRSGHVAGSPAGAGSASPSAPGSARLRTTVVQPPDAARLRDALAGAGLAAAAGPIGASADLRSLGIPCTSRTPPGALCAHGSEPPPLGIDAHRLPTVAQLHARRFGGVPPGLAKRSSAGQPDAAAADSAVVTPEVVESAGTVPCVGDGSSGPRVQAIYAHAADTADRYTAVLPLIQQYAADVSARIDAAAGRSGRGRVVRFVTTGSPCVLAVANVTLSATGDDSFTNTVAELRDLGYNQADRKYLVWVDAAVGICGIGHVYSDDKPTADNRNAGGNMFARTDTPCWGYADLHELLHTLGAVQDSAPDSTRAGHCVDQTDTMCYSDTSGAAMRQVCSNAPDWNIDCQLNDYFNADPAPGSYLATHWNTANSPYLASAAAPPTPPALSITAPASAFAGNPVPVTGSVQMPAGRSVSELSWTSSRTDCRFAAPHALSSRFWCPVTAAGGVRLTLWLRDTSGAETSATYDLKLTVPATRRSTALTLTRSVTAIRAGQKATLRGTLSDKGTGKAIIGMPVALYRHRAGQTTWSKVSTGTTTSTGGVAFTVQPAGTTDYQLISGYTTTWATARSPIRGLTVTG
jgi:hypothetical protein